MTDITPSATPKAARRHLLELLAIGVGAVAAFVALSIAATGEQTAFEDLALGRATTSYYATVDGVPIHCQTLEDAAGCLDGFAARGSERVVLWLGNSQLHAINQLQPGDETASPKLFRRLRGSGRDVITFSQPNANLQEHYVLFTYLRQRLPVEWLVLPIVFDDLREIGVRGELTPALDDPAVVAALEGTAAGRGIVDLTAITGGGDFAALEDTVQDAVETDLNDWLAEHVGLWAERPELRGRLATDLRRWRNTLFGVTAQSERRVIPGRYELNLAALEAMLDDAARSGIQVLVYVVPIRDDVAIPYDAAEYARFQEELAAVAARHGAAFANLESLVPAELWGLKDATDADGDLELDFMHFQGPGHDLLAEAVGDLLEAEIGGGGG